MEQHSGPFLLLRISFLGRPIFIRLPPGPPPGDQEEQEELQHVVRRVHCHRGGGAIQNCQI